MWTIKEIDNYVEHGLDPGSFYSACLANDLDGALKKADGKAKIYLDWILSYISKKVPSQARGSYEAVRSWKGKGGSMKVVVTRHRALIEHLINIGLVDSGDTILEHATPEDVEGKDVIGVLPLSLAALANSVTEVPMNLPANLRGKELSLQEVEMFSGRPVKYVVNRS